MNKMSNELHDNIVANLKEVYDPEIPVNIYDLGLIYNIDINESSTLLRERVTQRTGQFLKIFE